MREILFRGQTRKYGEKVKVGTGEKLPGEWVYGGIFPQNKGGCYSIIYTYDPIAKRVVYADTVGQYTGLTDVNGKKIFEGDICDFAVFDYNDRDTQYRGVVVYAGSRFMLWKSVESEYYGADGGFDLDWVVGQYDEFEVIGNIHDTPELLKQSENAHGHIAEAERVVGEEIAEIGASTKDELRRCYVFISRNISRKRLDEMVKEFEESHPGYEPWGYHQYEEMIKEEQR